MRTAVQVIRELNLVKASMKGEDKAMMKALCKPLEDELAEIAAALQGQLPGIPPKTAGPSK